MRSQVVVWIIISHTRKRRRWLRICPPLRLAQILRICATYGATSNAHYSASVAPRGNILGWAGLIMARSMYSLLTRTPFRVPTDPGPLAIYYPPPRPIVDAQGNQVLDEAGLPTYQARPVIERAAQATIDAQFKRAKNYYELYLNI